MFDLLASGLSHATVFSRPQAAAYGFYPTCIIAAYETRKDRRKRVRTGMVAAGREPADLVALLLSAPAAGGFDP